MGNLLSVAKFLLPVAAAGLFLSACGQEQTERTYATDVEDKSGGELIVTEQDPNAIPVTTPDTPMTNVPPEATPSPSPTPTSTVSPTPTPTPE
jgi:hypothetical protein